MADRYENLERLQRLRENGTLTEEEFVAEKLSVLEQSKDVEIKKVHGQLGIIIPLALLSLTTCFGLVFWWYSEPIPKQKPAAAIKELQSPPVVSDIKAQPPVTKPVNKASQSDWIVGTWRHENRQLRWSDGCETDVLIYFEKNGKYSDGGAEGRYKIEGNKITYSSRKSVPDIAADPDENFVPEKLPVIVSTFKQIGENKFQEGGERWQRCK